MAHRVQSSANWSSRGRLLPPGRRLARKSHSAWHDLCGQCGFPWGLHPERYDPEEDATVRFCSEYPASGVWSIQSCICP
ncbi:MAG TPA: hypothetical protein VFA17_06795 [Thermoplasmata archaeon]|nr:hypothetical protein [Thermoplasmata archaeon]